MSRHHLTDTELIGLCFDDTTGSSEAHVAGCATCQSRRQALRELLDDATTAASADADQAFPATALARQHSRIMARVEHETRPARVISFPVSHTPAPVRYARTGSRWLAAAVAAGVILGIVGEHVTHRVTRAAWGGRGAPIAGSTTAPARGVAVRAIAVTGSDDEFLGQVELAFGSAGPATLRPLDVLTPRAWDVRE